LAERFVSLSSELEEVRNRMRKALANGSAGEPARARPTAARSKRPGNQKAKAAKTADNAILTLLKEQSLGPAAIARATDAKPGTVSDRLRRLANQGLVERGDDGWRAISSP
jgi:hypothetical protein